MSETATERIYRTRDGRLVDGKNAGAAFLAYAVGDELSPADAAGWKKERAVPADKSRRPAQNKAVTKPPASE